MNLKKWRFEASFFFFFILLAFLFFFCFLFFYLFFNFILFYLFLTSFRTLQKNNLTFSALYKNTNSNFFGTLQEVLYVSENKLPVLAKKLYKKTWVAYFQNIEFFENLKNVLIKSCPNNTKFLLY